MPDHFQTLEIMFTVHKTCWKYHKSKDNKVLHRSYTKKYSQLRRNFSLERVQKKCNQDLQKSEIENLQKSEIEKFKMSKIKNCDFFVEKFIFFPIFLIFFTSKNIFSWG